MKYRTRSDAAATVAKALRRRGHSGATTEIIKHCLDAWLDGKRGSNLPHILGHAAGIEFDEVTALRPGFLEGLRNE